jgi:hypothetical protein
MITGLVEEVREVNEFPTQPPRLRVGKRAESHHVQGMPNFPRLRVVACAAAALVVFSAARPLTAHAQATGTATLLGYQTTVPTGWVSSQPSSNMRLTEYKVPGPTGTLPFEAVVYFFGPGQGGSPEANLARWKSQFSNPAGGPVAETVTHETVRGMPYTIAEYRGTYARGVGMGSSADAARPDHILLAVVAETPKGTLFFQCYGPSAAVEKQRAACLNFARGLK